MSKSGQHLHTAGAVEVAESTPSASSNVGALKGSDFPYQQAPISAYAPSVIQGGGAQATAVPSVPPTSSGYGGGV